MEVLSNLAEYLAAYQETNTKVSPVSIGSQHLTIPMVPPGALITYQANPAGAYAVIVFWMRWSPAMVPDVFFVDLLHRGIFLQSGTVGVMNMKTGYNTWVVVTEGNPAIVRILNLSNMNQFFDASFFYLSATSAEDLAKVNELVKGYKP